MSRKSRSVSEYHNIFICPIGISGITRRGRGGRTAPGDTLQGLTPEGKKILWANLQRIVEKRGRTGKKRCGDTMEGVTPE